MLHIMRWHMPCPTLLALGLLLAPLAHAADDAGSYPRPSPYPITWELKFRHQPPRRIVVDTGSGAPQAYWYVVYSVTNNTGQERTFLPFFEMLTSDGTVIRSDRNIPYQVFKDIKAREKNQFLEHFTQIGGEIRLGEDEARTGVAIWKEPKAEMGSFSIFLTGLSGETARIKDAQGNELKDADGKPIILRKTIQLNYYVRGDEVYPGLDEVNSRPQAWVMR